MAAAEAVPDRAARAGVAALGAGAARAAAIPAVAVDRLRANARTGRDRRPVSFSLLTIQKIKRARNPGLVSATLKSRLDHRFGVAAPEGAAPGAGVVVLGGVVAGGGVVVGGVLRCAVVVVGALPTVLVWLP